MSGPVGSKVRLFFAAVPDLVTGQAIAAAAAAMVLPAETRLVPRSNYHMTLAFIGEVATQAIPTLRAIGGAQRAPPFSLTCDAYEYWPKPEVIVGAARTVPTAMERLWVHLHRELASHGWALAPKRLRPHVTLARKVSQAPVLQAMSPFDWPVHEFCLMSSEPSGIRSAYTVVDRWPLLDNVEKA